MLKKIATHFQAIEKLRQSCVLGAVKGGNNLTVAKPDFQKRLAKYHNDKRCRQYSHRPRVRVRKKWQEKE